MAHRLFFTYNRPENVDNHYVVGSGVGSKSHFVRSALRRKSSNNAQGKPCCFKDTNYWTDVSDCFDQQGVCISGTSTCSNSFPPCSATTVGCSDKWDNSIPTPTYILPLLYGENAGYGATPYYSPIVINCCTFNLFVDTGTAYSWITTDLCNTPACKKHKKLKTNGAVHNATTINFGPWGSLKVTLNATNRLDVNMKNINNFGLMYAVDYSGLKFGTLYQDGALSIYGMSPNTTGTSDILDRLNVHEIAFAYHDNRCYIGHSPYTYTYIRCVQPDDTRFDCDDIAKWCVRLLEIRIGNATVDFPHQMNIAMIDTGSSCFKSNPRTISSFLQLFLKSCSTADFVGDEKALEDKYPSVDVVVCDPHNVHNNFTLTFSASAFFRIENLDSTNCSSNQQNDCIYSLDIQTFGEDWPSPSEKNGGITLGSNQLCQLKSTSFNRLNRSTGFCPHDNSTTA